MQDIRIYNETLNESEIKNIMNFCDKENQNCLKCE